MADADNQAMLLGEIRGQVRELIHNQNNTSMRLEAKIDKLTERVGELEVLAGEQKGASNLWQLLLKSPVVAWLFAAGVMLWAAIKGKLSL